MDTELAPSPAPNPLHRVLFNDRGLRAGWRLLIYLAMIFVLVLAARFITGHLGGTAKGSSPPPVLRTIFQAVGELILFLVFVFLAWIMSKIEHRKLGAYGLPLNRNIWGGFVRGYFFWGFLPLAALLAVLRIFHAFDFGTLSPLNKEILGWGVLWFFVFLLVGLLEEYSLRGYLLFTLADGIGFWPAAIIQALIFARFHMGNTGETKIGIIATAVFALFAAATLWRTGTLWLAVGAHAGWDWGQSFFFGVNDSGFQAPGHLLNPHAGHGPDWLTGGTVGPEGSVVTLVLWSLMTLAFVLFFRSRGPALVITADRKN